MRCYSCTTRTVAINRGYISGLYALPLNRYRYQAVSVCSYPPMSRLPVSEPFVATNNEVQLADRILGSNTWTPSKVLTIDSAINILRKNGLSYKEIREIWSIVDRNGTGKLTKDELYALIRLMGWVQAGEILNAQLLTKGM